jgi:hypothetical protein
MWPLRVQLMLRRMQPLRLRLLPLVLQLAQVRKDRRRSIINW